MIPHFYCYSRHSSAYAQNFLLTKTQWILIGAWENRKFCGNFHSSFIRLSLKAAPFSRISLFHLFFSFLIKNWKFHEIEYFLLCLTRFGQKHERTTSFTMTWQIMFRGKMENTFLYSSWILIYKQRFHQLLNVQFEGQKDDVFTSLLKPFTTETKSLRVCIHISKSYGMRFVEITNC